MGVPENLMYNDNRGRPRNVFENGAALRELFG